MNATLDVEALYRRYGPMVLRRCRSILRDEAEAMDAMQEVFVQVLRRRLTLRDEYPASLLYRIATNTSLNGLRSRRRRRWVTADDLVAEAVGTDDPEARAVNRVMLDQVFRGEKKTRGPSPRRAGSKRRRWRRRRGGPGFRCRECASGCGPCARGRWPRAEAAARSSPRRTFRSAAAPWAAATHTVAARATVCWKLTGF